MGFCSTGDGTCRHYCSDHIALGLSLLQVEMTGMMVHQWASCGCALLSQEEHSLGRTWIDASTVKESHQLPGANSGTLKWNVQEKRSSLSGQSSSETVPGLIGGMTKESIDVIKDHPSHYIIEHMGDLSM